MSKLEEYIEKYRKIHTAEDFYKRSAPVKLDKAYVIKGKQNSMSGWQGWSKFRGDILRVSEKLGRPISILDYGCGQPLATYRHFFTHPMNIRSWCSYDPALPGFDVRPTGQYDFVICADVVEHIPEEALNFVLDDIRSFVSDSGFLGVSTCGEPSYQSFSDGENFHCTLKTSNEWKNILRPRFENLIFVYTRQENGVRRQTKFTYGL